MFGMLEVFFDAVFVFRLPTEAPACSSFVHVEAIERGVSKRARKTKSSQVTPSPRGRTPDLRPHAIAGG